MLEFICSEFIGAPCTFTQFLAIHGVTRNIHLFRKEKAVATKRNPLTLFVGEHIETSDVYERGPEETNHQFLMRMQKIAGKDYSGAGGMAGHLVGIMSKERLESYRQSQRDRLATKERAAAQAIAEFDGSHSADPISADDEEWTRRLRKTTAALAGNSVYQHIPVINRTECIGNGLVRIELKITGITTFCRCLKFFE